jgi:hypothetical protein
VLTTSTIDTFKKQGVSIIDASLAYLAFDMDEEVFMCLRGKLAELVVDMAPEIYRKYIYNNTPFIYVKLQKSLYRYLRSALLFYLKLLSDLEDNEFTPSPYNPRVASKIAIGKQFTITCHVEDMKLSRVDENEVTKP